MHEADDDDGDDDENDDDNRSTLSHTSICDSGVGQLGCSSGTANVRTTLRNCTSLMGLEGNSNQGQGQVPGPARCKANDAKKWYLH